MCSIKDIKSNDRKKTYLKTVIYKILMRERERENERERETVYSRVFIGHHAGVWFPVVSISLPRGRTFTEKDRNKPNYRIGPKRT